MQINAVHATLRCNRCRRIPEYCKCCYSTERLLVSKILARSCKAWEPYCVSSQPSIVMIRKQQNKHQSLHSRQLHSRIEQVQGVLTFEQNHRRDLKCCTIGDQNGRSPGYKAGLLHPFHLPWSLQGQRIATIGSLKDSASPDQRTSCQGRPPQQSYGKVFSFGPSVSRQRMNAVALNKYHASL